MLAGEKKQQVLAGSLLGDNLEAEATPMSFSLNGGREEVRATPFAYVPNLTDKVVQMLEQNINRYTKKLANLMMLIPLACLTAIVNLCGIQGCLRMRSGLK